MNNKIILLPISIFISAFVASIFTVLGAAFKTKALLFVGVSIYFISFVLFIITIVIFYQRKKNEV